MCLCHKSSAGSANIVEKRDNWSLKNKDLDNMISSNYSYSVTLGNIYIYMCVCVCVRVPGHRCYS